MTAVEATTAPVIAEEIVVTPAGPKRDLHRMQRIFRGTKAKLTTRPFTKASAAEGTNAALLAVTLNQLKALTADLTAEEVASALADAEPIPAVVAEMSARAARFGVVEPVAAPKLTAEEKAARAETLKKRAERFGAADAAADPLAAVISKIDPAILAARESRFADPRAEELKAAEEKRAARFGTNNNNSSKAAPAIKVAPVELTPEQQAALDARARRFGA